MKNKLVFNILSILIISVNYPSDGLLPQYTQCLQGLPNNDGTRYKVNGANHLEVRNMSAGSTDETYDEFVKIFNREDWFNTD